MRRYERQTLDQEEAALLTSVSKTMRALLPEDTGFLSVIMLPGGPTGRKARLISNMGEKNIVPMLEEILIAIHQLGPLQHYTPPKDS